MAPTTFSGLAPPAMTELAPDSVISIGSFSKVIWGGLRIGWIRAPARPFCNAGPR